MEANVADLTTWALQGVIDHGTGVAANIGRPAAGKTGTAQNYQDAWFCGYVPQLAACVWVGYPKTEDRPLDNIHGFAHVFGGTIPALIWHQFMSAAVQGMPVKGFEAPSFDGWDVQPERIAPIPVAPPPPPKEPPPGHHCKHPPCKPPHGDTKPGETGGAGLSLVLLLPAAGLAATRRRQAVVVRRCACRPSRPTDTAAVPTMAARMANTQTGRPPDVGAGPFTGAGAAGT
jgi:membrane peptidoglycan carboxypeptidase